MKYTLFPNRVWEPTENGWASREATASDQKRRGYVEKFIMGEIDSKTMNEQIKEMV